MSWADGGDPAEIRGRGHRLGHMSHGQNGHMPLETLLDCGFLNLDLQKKNFCMIFCKGTESCSCPCVYLVRGEHVSLGGEEEKKRNHSMTSHRKRWRRSIDTHVLLCTGCRVLMCCPPSPCRAALDNDVIRRRGTLRTRQCVYCTICTKRTKKTL